MEDEDFDDLINLEQEIQEEEPDYYEDIPDEELDELQYSNPVPPTKQPTVEPPKRIAAELDYDIDSYLHEVPVSKPAKKSAEEFAKYIQAARIASVGLETGLDHGNRELFDASCRFLHEQPLYQKLSLREVAPHMSSLPSDASKNNYSPIVLANGKQFFIKNRSPRSTTAVDSAPAVFQPYRKNLLTASYSDLEKQVDELNIQAQLLKTRIQTQRVSVGSSSASAAKPTTEELWVDKYAPKSFTQLLSMEKTNREVLKALKRWDRFVFKKSADSQTTSSSSKTTSVTGTNGDASEGDIQARLFAEDGRPRNKVILLCGPPGTGKTTLAHVAAVHCGYRPFEVNASDDRSPDVLKDMLARATQNTTLDSDKRPNCIIFDEIDGMDGNKDSLSLLLDVIRAPLSSTGTGGGKSGGGGGKKSKKTNGAATGSFALTRPLICICNDQYAPVLRDLRKLSDIFVFNLPSEMRLLQRVKTICWQEQIDLTTAKNSAVLAELIAVTGCDIRSTINNLQFAAMRARDSLAQRPVSSSSSASSSTTQTVAKSVDLGQVITAMMQSGLKDDQLDAFQVWQRVFFASSPSKKKDNKKADATSKLPSTTNGAKSDDDASREMMLAIDAMQDHGDYDHLIAGIHENIFSRASTNSATIGAMNNYATNNSSGYGTTATSLNTASSYHKPHNLHVPTAETNARGLARLHQLSASSGIHATSGTVTSGGGNSLIAQHAVSSDWLSYADMLQEMMRVANDGFQLLAHVAVLGGAVHLCHRQVSHASKDGAGSSSTTSSNAAVTAKGRLKWPKTDRDAYYARLQRRNVLQSLQETALAHGAASFFTSKQVLAVDYIASLLDIFTPRNVRAQPWHGLSPAEKQTLMLVIQAMESCGVAYTPQAVTDPNHSKQNNLGVYGGGRKPFGNKNSTTSKVKSKDGDFSNLFLQEDQEIIYMLDPHLWLLVQYSPHLFRASNGAIEDHETVSLAARRYHSMHIAPEVRSAIFLEQRKYAVTRWEEKATMKAQQQPKQNPNPTATLFKSARDTSSAANVSTADQAMPMEEVEETSDSKPLAAVPVVNPWDRPETAAEEERRGKGSLSSFLVKRAAPSGTGGTGAVSKKAKGGSHFSSVASAFATAVSNNAASTAANPTSVPVESKKKSGPVGVVFKFNQGYSNAVRRPVYLHDFLPGAAAVGTKKAT